VLRRTCRCRRRIVRADREHRLPNVGRRALARVRLAWRLGGQIVAAASPLRRVSSLPTKPLLVCCWFRVDGRAARAAQVKGAAAWQRFRRIVAPISCPVLAVTKE
jgi:hypothetical protein